MKHQCYALKAFEKPKLNYIVESDSFYLLTNLWISRGIIVDVFLQEEREQTLLSEILELFRDLWSVMLQFLCEWVVAAFHCYSSVLNPAPTHLAAILNSSWRPWSSGLGDFV